MPFTAGGWSLRHGILFSPFIAIAGSCKASGATRSWKPLARRASQLSLDEIRGLVDEARRSIRSARPLPQEGDSDFAVSRTDCSGALCGQCGNARIGHPTHEAQRCAVGVRWTHRKARSRSTDQQRVLGNGISRARRGRDERPAEARRHPIDARMPLAELICPDPSG